MAIDVHRAVANRDRAFARTRQATAVAVGVGAALTAAFAAVAGSSTHLRKTVAHSARIRRDARKPVTAPRPPLVAAHEAPPPAPPPQAVPQDVTPVVVSGGS